ncbi:hypothetical protein K466DRAFT_97244 [Polyporus arcularius HHB13444]|uniref:Uncharacterized protein n=1 Tax=Polyporus arcularius HHB13444 TaxID=1314778 RepID=A0A5C3PDZ1_9APHY|nr:hypothetical protein K466DRAFT_97244 [Polyporus arcularius HHB13444]
MGPDRSKWQCYPPAFVDSESDSVPIISWQPDPTFRGTLDIFTSCILTLFLCVWTASHVDIQTGKSTLGRWLAKCGWLLLALFCPELLFYIAFKQLRVAVRLTLEGQRVLQIAGASARPSRTMQVLAWVVGVRKVELSPPPDVESPERGDMQKSASDRPPSVVESPHDQIKIRGKSPPDDVLYDDKSQPKDAAGASPPDVDFFKDYSKLEDEISGSPPDGKPSGGDVAQAVPRRKHCWTLVHGFYAAMGGFVLNDPEIDSQDHYLPAWQRNGVLTPMGVLFLMEHAPSLIPDLSSSDILDRSKADGLAKILLVCQVLWFLLTCINRAVEGLPLSLLEVITIAHALCSLLTYALWWRKPKDVEHQTVIEGQDVRPIGAWLSMKSGACRFLIGGLLCFHGKSEAYFRKRGAEYWDELRRGSEHTFRKAVMARFPFRTTTRTPWYVQGSVEGEDERRAREERWALAEEVHERFSQHDPARFVIPTASLQAYATHMPAYPADDDIGLGTIIRNVGIIVVLGAAYGLPHLIGSTVMFASAGERTVWLVATALVAAMGVGFLVVLILLRISLVFLDLLLKLLIDGHDSKTFCDRWSRPSFILGCISVSIVYFSSSAYLVGESLRQLFALPPDAFALPSLPLGSYWPHFS